jgi:hypothetical protein
MTKSTLTMQDRIRYVSIVASLERTKTIQSHSMKCNRTKLAEREREVSVSHTADRQSASLPTG